MSANRGPRPWHAGLAIGIVMLLLPASANAAAPVCEAGPFLYDLPAGLTHVHPRSPCKDADGDAITIEVRTAPHLGTLTPAGTISIDTVRFYTASASAGSLPAPRDTMTFVAHAGGEESNPVKVDVKILPPDHAPVCNDVVVTVESGRSVRIPTPQCVDVDNAAPKIIFDAPAHGTYDAKTGRYRSKPGFTGKDTMTFAAIDYWGVSSKVRKVAIKVTKGSGTGHGGGGSRDRTAPKLAIDVPRFLEIGSALRDGILFTAKTNEASRLAVRLYVDRKTARRFGLKQRPAKRVRVGTAVRHILAGKTVLKVNLSRRARTRLTDAHRVRVTMVAKISDAAGNHRTKHKKIVLRRGG